MSFSCLMAGVGGQGIVLASRLLGQAAMRNGDFARTAETIGMAQRGGSVVSHVRIGEEHLSPLIPEGGADLLIGFEPGEAVRCLKYLKPGGVMIVNSEPVQPVMASLTGAAYDGAAMVQFLKDNVAKLIIVDGRSATGQCGSKKALNVVMIGAAAKSGALPMDLQKLEWAMKSLLPEKLHEINLRALGVGAAWMEEFK